MTMNRETVKRLRAQIQEQLDDMGAMLGYRMTLRGCTYSEVAMFQLEVAPIPLDGTVVSKESADFKRCAVRYGMKPSALGQEISFMGRTYTIVGAKPRSRKFPILCRRADGQLCKVAALTVRRNLAPEHQVPIPAGNFG